MKLELGLGAGSQTVEIPDACVQQVLEPNQVARGLTGEAADMADQLAQEAIRQGLSALPGGFNF